MKKVLLTVIVAAGVAGSTFGQGVLLRNLANNSLSTAATSLGLVWTNVGNTYGLFNGYDYNLGIEIYAGASSSSLTYLGTVIPGVAGCIYTGADYGLFNQIPEVTWNTGVTPGSLAWIQLNVWWYEQAPTATSYNQAKAMGAFFGSVLFQNPTSNPGGAPPTPDQTLTGMPALIMIVPEPSTIALAGIGLASLLIFRRRK